MNTEKEGNRAVSHYPVTSGEICTSNLHATEVLREKKHSLVNISVVLLDHTEVIFKVNKRDRGQVLLDLVFKHLRVIEIQFFGLQFANDVPDTMRWLDPTKSIRKQFKRGYPYILFFRVKFYANDITSMKEEFSRYQLFLQIKLDLLEKRMQCHMSTAAVMASLALQSELGDYNFEEHKNNYVSEFKFIPNQTKEFEVEIQRLHKLHRGLSPSQAEYQFIKKAQRLDMYGVEIHHGKDLEEEDLQVGVTSTGILLFQNSRRINEFKWSSIVKFSFKRKQFYIQFSPIYRQQNFTDHIYSFHMDNFRACKRLWKSCVDFHSFYRLDNCINTSHTHQHLMSNHTTSCETVDTKSEKPLFGFFTLGGHGKYHEKHDAVVRRDNRLKDAHHAYGESTTPMENLHLSLNSNVKIMDQKAPRRLSAPPSVSYGVGGSIPSDEKLSLINRSKPQCQIPSNNVEIDAGSSQPPIKPQFHNPMLTGSSKQLHVSTTVDVDETAASEISVATAMDSECSSVATSMTEKSSVCCTSVLPSRHQPLTIENNGIFNEVKVVKLKPDVDGRYGFNVKGGVDHNMPFSISKIAVNSPAALCSPSLNVGDYLLQINGRDVSMHSHDQVVRFIRSTREHHSGLLVLLVQPNCNQQNNNVARLLVNSDQYENPVFNSVDGECSMLDSSIQWLEEMVNSGEILTLFDDLYRKKPGCTTNDARLPANIVKNRYRDISPYDSTRIFLKSGPTDYINANHVDIPIPGTSCLNRYAASQGPLPNTCADFWTMVWEQQATLIVMLTAVVERGRPKCHQYWPDLGKIVQYGPWIIECVFEEITASFAFRDFKLKACDETDFESPSRLIQQMQYIAWPDHGVPDDSSDFLNFVIQVRQKRVGMKVPCVVHCSAGIGRTGVLITMETAMCLMEANQPVYPLDIAQTLRDQRAMMIQTPSQFKFVCDAIVKVYKEVVAKPMMDNEDLNSDETNMIQADYENSDSDTQT